MFRTMMMAALAALLAQPALAASEEKSETQPGQAMYLPLDPAFVVNVLDPNSRRPRFMQVKVQVMTREGKVASALEANVPPVRDAMIMLLAHQDSATMGSVEGREAVRAKAQNAIQQVLAEVAGIESGVEAVYFTDFVIQ